MQLVGAHHACKQFALIVRKFVIDVKKPDLLIPSGTPTGNAVPVLIQIGGSKSQQGVTIAIRSN
jgi:hypothetical protein